MSKPIVLTVDKIVERLVEDHNIEVRDATDFVETWLDDMRAAITEGKRVKLAGFGSLALKSVKSLRAQRLRKALQFDETEGLENKWRTVSLAVSQDLRSRAARAVANAPDP